MSFMTEIRAHEQGMVQPRATRGAVAAMTAVGIGLGIAFPAVGSDSSTRVASPVSVERAAPAGIPAQIGAATQPGISIAVGSASEAVRVGSGTNPEATRAGLAAQPGVAVEAPETSFAGAGVSEGELADLLRPVVAAEPEFVVPAGFLTNEELAHMLQIGAVSEPEIVAPVGLFTDEELAELLALR